MCTVEKYHFVSIKGWYVLCTVIKIDSHVFPMRPEFLSCLKFVLDSVKINPVVFCRQAVIRLLKTDGNVSAALVIRLIILPLLFVYSRGRLNLCATGSRKKS